MSVKISNPVTIVQSGGGGKVPSEDDPIRFYDYDGTLLYSYTSQEAEAMTALPAGPTNHPNLTFDGWTEDLSTVQLGGYRDIGAMYTASSNGDASFFLITPPEANWSQTIKFNQSAADGVEVDWGDGSPVETSSTSGNTLLTHTYSNTGNQTYKITLTPVQGATLNFNNGAVFGQPDSNFSSKICYMPITICLGKCGLGQYAFANLRGLTYVILSKKITSLNVNYLFRYSTNVRFWVFPPNQTIGGNNVFANVYQWMKNIFPSSSLTNTSYPVPVGFRNTRIFPTLQFMQLGLASTGIYEVVQLPITSSGSSVSASFISTSRIRNLRITKGTAALPTQSLFVYNVGSSSGNVIDYFDFRDATQVVAASSTSLDNLPLNTTIVVPDALYEDWIVAENWASYSNQIIKASDYEALQ